MALTPTASKCVSTPGCNTRVQPDVVIPDIVDPVNRPEMADADLDAIRPACRQESVVKPLAITGSLAGEIKAQ